MDTGPETNSAEREVMESSFMNASCGCFSQTSSDVSKTLSSKIRKFMKTGVLRGDTRYISSS